MGSLFHSEVDCRFFAKACVQVRVTADVSKIHGDSEKISKLQDYVNGLEDEMMKIDGFKRELPLCMALLGEAILAVKEELGRLSLKPVPVLEEFIPLKKTCAEEKKNDKEQDSKVKGEDNSIKDKMNWMSSVQLWKTDNTPNFPNADKLSLEVENNKKGKEEELKRPVMDKLFQSRKNREVERAFVPFKGCNFPVMAVGKEYVEKSPIPGLSLCTPGIKNSREEMSMSLDVQSNMKAGQQQTGRKQRRCWSAELHRQFTEALEHLGGPQGATPKQIRERMQVNGLTNDEVKSHLQKYRAHIKRKSTSNSQTVGCWSSQEECKQRNSKSNSPDGPLQLSECNGVDDEDDFESEGCSSNIQK